MAEVNTMEMLSYIRNFILNMNDYDPLELGEVDGCYNTKYHGNLCQATINPPVSLNSPTSYPRVIIAYIVKGDDIIVCDSSLNSYKLTECLGYSIKNVYDEIKLASSYKMKYENTKKEGY